MGVLGGEIECDRSEVWAFRDNGYDGSDCGSTDVSDYE